MSITSLGAGLAPLSQAASQATAPKQAPASSRETQQSRPHHHHDEKPPVSTDPGSTTSASTTGSQLNQLV